MVKGLYTSALGMITQMYRMDVVTNNLANVDTPGYKRDIVAAQSFSAELMKRINEPGIRLFKDYPLGMVSQGVYVDDIYTDYSMGSFRQTKGPFDLAIAGSGFFCVQVNGAELYTRDGTFTLRPDGVLVTKDNGVVMGERGEIKLTDGNVFIDEKGRVYAGGEFIDTLKLIDFSDRKFLHKLENNYYKTTDDSKPIPFTGRVEQGMLENSNANTVREMVEMIALSRQYESNARMIAFHDAMMSHSANDIARR
jgi:flagellar basal-body rod protein FlgG